MFYILKVYNLANNNNNIQTNLIRKFEIIINTIIFKKGYMLLYKMTNLAFLGDSGVEAALNFLPKYDFWGSKIKIIAP